MTFPKSQDAVEAERREAIDKFIFGKCANLPCGVCAKADWQGGEFCSLVGVTPEAGFVGGDGSCSLAGGVKPEDVVVALRCKGCGRVVLFSAKAIGIDLRR